MGSLEDFQDLDGRLKEIFKWFHSHPELSYKEYETTKKIREILEEEGVEILPGNRPDRSYPGRKGRSDPGSSL